MGRNDGKVRPRNGVRMRASLTSMNSTEPNASLRVLMA